DFLEKPLQRERVLVSVRNALSGNRLRTENQELKRRVEDASVLLGDSEPMKRLRSEIGRAAPTGATVLILGERGTGKELVAREDLYFRLNVVPLTTPPLRERREDIPALVTHFARVFADRDHRKTRRFTAAAMNLLASRAWPGNVRELRNLVERVLIMADTDPI